MATKKVYSSHISEVGYDQETSELIVVWQNGSSTVYADVPLEVGQSVENAPSVGEALHRMVKGKYPFATNKARDGD